MKNRFEEECEFWDSTLSTNVQVATYKEAKSWQGAYASKCQSLADDDKVYTFDIASGSYVMDKECVDNLSNKKFERLAILLTEAESIAGVANFSNGVIRNFDIDTDAMFLKILEHRSEELFECMARIADVYMLDKDLDSDNDN